MGAKAGANTNVDMEINIATTKVEVKLKRVQYI